jgi:hypothetical protein
VNTALLILVLVVVAALAFDYINGFHDAANAVATVVSTGVLPLRTAILLAAMLNFAGALTGTAVAATIGKGLVEPGAITQGVVLAALSGAHRLGDVAGGRQLVRVGVGRNHGEPHQQAQGQIRGLHQVHGASLRRGPHIRYS